jgi:nucleotide-binding universal stress UspA family protein
MQSLRDILVYLDDGDSNSERINTALAMAKNYGARLTGATLAALVPAHVKVTDEKTLVHIADKEARQRAEHFERLATEHGIECTTRIIDGELKHAPTRFARYARNFDLVILRQANPSRDNFQVIKAISEQVVLLSGRPIFFMPYIGAHRMPCRKVMIAWSGSPTTTRAIHDALPLIERVEEVVLLVVEKGTKPSERGVIQANNMREHLQRHGVNAEIRRVPSGTFEVATVILNEVVEGDYDLLVMGGYGTPSLHQKIFGGVTRTILSSMLVPVFMSH